MVFRFYITCLQVIFCKEKFHGISGLSFAISLARPTLSFNTEAMLALFQGSLHTLTICRNGSIWYDQVLVHFVFCIDACFSIILGNNEHAEGLKFYLLSRDPSKLKSEFHSSNGKVGLISNLTYMIRMHECLLDQFLWYLWFLVIHY